MTITDMVYIQEEPASGYVERLLNNYQLFTLTTLGDVWEVCHKNS